MSDDLHPISQDRLFRFQQPVLVAGRELVVRALSSYETRCRYEEALLASAAVRREMKDPASRRYQLGVGLVLEEASDDELRRLLVLAARNRARLEAADQLQPEFVAYPDGASEDEKRDTVDRRQTALETAKALQEKYIAGKVDNRTAEIAEWPTDKLVAAYLKVASETATDNEFGEIYGLAGLLYGVRQADGSPYFTDLADVRELPDDIRLYLHAKLRSINDLDPLALSGPSSTATPPVPGS